METLCATGQKLQHRNAILIKEQASLVGVKTILRKYDIKSYAATGREAERMLQHLMKRGGEDGLSDALAVCHVIGGKEEHEVEEIYLEHLVVEKEDTREAINFLRKAFSKNMEKGRGFARHLVSMAELVLKMEVGQSEERWIEVVKALPVLLGPDNCQELLEKVNKLTRAWDLKSEFGLKVKETDCQGEAPSLASKEAASCSLSRFICQQIEEARKGETDETEGRVQRAYSRLLRLCDLLDVAQEEGVARLVLHLAKEGLTHEAMQVAATLSDCPVTSQLAESLVTVIHRVEGELGDEEEEVDHLINLLSQFTRQILSYCAESSLADGLELASWQILGAAIHREGHSRKAFSHGGGVDPYTSWRFSPLYNDKGLPLDRSSVLPLVRCLLGLLLPSVDTPALPYLPRHASANVETQDLDVTAPDLETLGAALDAKQISEGVLAAGQEIVLSLQQAGHCMLAFQALARLEAPLASILLGTDPDMATSIQSQLSKVKSSLVTQLLNRVLGETKTDFTLALGLVGSESKRADSLKLLANINSSLGMDFKRVVGLASVGKQHCNGLGLLKQGNQFNELYVRACWGKMLADLNINFKNAYNGSKGERLIVLQELVKRKEVEAPTLMKYTRAFDIGRDEALTLYTEALLFGMVAMVDERGEVVVENFQESTEKINVALKLIGSDETGMEHFEKMLSTVCPYNYHVLQFLLSHLTKYGKDNAKYVKADRILGFLMHYTRVSDPVAEFEVDPWLKDRRGAFPYALAKLRLPLTAITSLSQKEKFKLLEKEFTMETHKAWLAVAGVMGLSTDNIIYYVVKNTVTSIMDQQVNEGESWVLGHVNRSMLEEIQQCIRLMKEPEKAAAASFWVLNRLPPGSDKVV